MTDPQAHYTASPVDAKRRSELSKRVLSSLALASLALVSGWFGGVAFACVWGVAALIVLREWMTIIGVDGGWTAPPFVVGALGILTSIMVLFLPVPSALLAFGPAVLAGLILVFWLPKSGISWLWNGFGPLYAASIIVGPLALRSRTSDGLVILIWLFLVVWISDIGAFFVGRTLGGPKLWPSISPKKTWSGSVGGLVAGTVVSVGFVLAVQAIFGPVWLTGWSLVMLSLSTAVVAEAGDLFESAMKRRFGVKDSGAIIPGHGGMMDRLDSYCAAALYVFLIGTLLGI